MRPLVRSHEGLRPGAQVAPNLLSAPSQGGRPPWRHDGTPAQHAHQAPVRRVHQALRPNPPPVVPPAAWWRRHLGTLLRYSAVSGCPPAPAWPCWGCWWGCSASPWWWPTWWPPPWAPCRPSSSTAAGSGAWGTADRRLAQVVPFTTLSFAGLSVSTVAVRVAATHTAGWSRGAHTLAVELANVAAYGALWVVQYVLLDRVLFRAGDLLADRGPVMTNAAPAVPRGTRRRAFRPTRWCRRRRGRRARRAPSRVPPPREGRR